MAAAVAPRLTLPLLFGSVLTLLIAITAGSSRGSVIAVATWSAAQWMPMISRSVRDKWQVSAWQYWEENLRPVSSGRQELATVFVQDHLDDLSSYLEETYGVHWRKRPLLLKGLWSAADLNNSSRRLSLQGLLQENLTIPYFTDARLQGALAPDARAPVRDVVANITRGEPHKIGTQFVVQTYPEMIQEVAPVNIVTELFGDYFTPDAIKGMGPFRVFPALTTVPMFVANGGQKPSPRSLVQQGEQQEEGAAAALAKQPFTALHCEPIGNVAVQLSGRKQWTLVRPEFSFLIRPSTSPDGRAFFASWALDYSHVPTYSAITEAGDAIWVPTWTWHRVDYMESKDIAIGGSLFHFRALDFFRNNPLFAVLIVPSLVLELVGYNTQ